MPETNTGTGADTDRFQAFKDRVDDLPPAWQMKAPGSKIGLLAGIVVVVAIFAAIFGALLVGLAGPGAASGVTREADRPRAGTPPTRGQRA